MTNPCSREFFEAFSSGAGSWGATCQCGRVYFASAERGVFDPGELEALLEKALDNPDRYIDTGDKSLLFVDLGAEYVHGCKCGAERKHEDWVWSHRFAIATYLKARASAAAAESKRLLDTLNDDEAQP